MTLGRLRVPLRWVPGFIIMISQAPSVEGEIMFASVCLNKDGSISDLLLCPHNSSTP